MQHQSSEPFDVVYALLGVRSVLQVMEDALGVFFAAQRVGNKFVQLFFVF
jgi:hypothetical protein